MATCLLVPISYSIILHSYAYFCILLHRLAHGCILMYTFLSFPVFYILNNLMPTLANFGLPWILLYTSGCTLAYFKYFFLYYFAYFYIQEVPANLCIFQKYIIFSHTSAYFVLLLHYFRNYFFCTYTKVT